MAGAILLFLSTLCLIAPIKGEQEIGEITLPETFSLLPEKRETAHGLSANQIVLKDQQRIQIFGLKFDGEGPDAFWIVGTGDPPTEHPGGEYPGDKIPNEKGHCIKLRGYNGTENVTLSLPKQFTFDQNKTTSFPISWLALYCFEKDHVYGHIKIPKVDQLQKFPENMTGNLTQPCVQPRPRWALASCSTLNHEIKLVDIIHITFNFIFLMLEY